MRRLGIAICMLVLAMTASSFPALGAEAETEQMEWQNGQAIQIEVDSVGSFREFSKTGGRVESSYPVFSVRDEAYPSLQTALDEYSEDLKSRSETSAEELTAVMRGENQNSGAYDEVYENAFSSFVCRADERVVSILTTKTGHRGAVPVDYLGYESRNIDPATGKVLSVEDVLLTPQALPRLLENEFERVHGTSGFYYDVSWEVEDRLEKGTLIFLIGLDGVSFVFPGYSIQTFAYAPTIITLYYDDYPGLFANDFSAGGPYFVRLSPDLKICHDHSSGERQYDPEEVLEMYCDSLPSGMQPMAENEDIAMYLVKSSNTERSVYVGPARVKGWESTAYSFKRFGSPLLSVHLEELTVNNDVLWHIMKAEAGNILTEDMPHPEHELLERFAHGEISAIDMNQDGSEQEIMLSGNKIGKHAFIDLDRDGIDEMIVEASGLSDPWNTLFRVENGKVFSIDLDEDVALVSFSEFGDRVFVDIYNHIIVKNKVYVGREYYTVYRYNEDKELAALYQYSRIWNEFDETKDSTCSLHETEGGGRDLTLEEYQSAVEKLEAGAEHLQFMP